MQFRTLMTLKSTMRVLSFLMCTMKRAFLFFAEDLIKGATVYNVGGKKDFYNITHIRGVLSFPLHSIKCP